VTANSKSPILRQLINVIPSHSHGHDYITSFASPEGEIDANFVVGQPREVDHNHAGTGAHVRVTALTKTLII
jgi:hypothetical protein